MKYGLFNNEEIHDFNKRMDYILGTNNTKNINSGDDNNSIEFDESNYVYEIKAPSDYDAETIQQCADLVDNKVHYAKDSFYQSFWKSPNIKDKINDSLALAVVKDKNDVVGCAILVDPTVENYKGHIPLEYYSLQSGYNLEGYIQQDLFVIRPNYVSKGISGKIRELLNSVSDKTFAIISEKDTQTISGLEKNNYKLIHRLEPEWELTPMQLWVNK